jgi:hypothetical protein
MEETLKQKQLFLRENILDKGYNADDFMNLLHSKKGESGLDLNNWRMNELTSVVQEFISMLNNPIKNNIQNQNQDNKIQPKKNIESDEYYEEICLKKYQEQKAEEEKEFGKCSKIEKTDFSKKNNIEIKISFPEKIDKGVFTKSFTSYLVETFPFKYQVRKRFSDFEWLQNIMNSQFVNYVIPPMPHKNFSDRFSEALILKRTRMLKKFLDGFLIHPTMRHSKTLQEFLSINSEEDFEELKKKYENIKNNPEESNNLQEIKSASGNIRISVNKEKEVYLMNIKDNAEINESIMKRITKSYKNLIDLMKNVSEKMKEIAELWKLLHEKSLKYYETTNTSESYKIMNTIMELLSNFENKKIELMNNDIREYFRYIKNEFHSMKDLSEKVDVHKDNYHKAFEKLNNNKENLYKQQDVTLWGLDEQDLKHKVVFLKNKDLAFSKMLPDESKNCLEIKNIYGAYLNSIIEEYERIRLLNGKRHKENISQFIKSLSQSLTELHISVVDQAAYFDEVKDEEELNDNDNEINNDGNNQYNQNNNGLFDNDNNNIQYNNRQFNNNQFDNRNYNNRNNEQYNRNNYNNSNNYNNNFYGDNNRNRYNEQMVNNRNRYGF